jgi:hypothetical protein
MTVKKNWRVAYEMEIAGLGWREFHEPTDGYDVESSARDLAAQLSQQEDRRNIRIESRRAPGAWKPAPEGST